MYAVIESGGKQHKVVEGEVLRLEKLEAAAGDKVNFDKVLMVADGDKVTLGEPYVAGGKVTAEVVEQGRGDKVTIIKFHRRKHHRKQAGHRQYFTEVKITDISVKAAAKKAPAKKVEKKAEKAEKAEPEAAAEE